MIVLDEQLLGRGIDVEIGKWYKGPVQFINDLRPGTVIKDEAITSILRSVDRPTFVTINDKDFWRKRPLDPGVCMVCFALSDSRAGEIPQLLRRLLRHPQLRSKAGRMGTMLRVADAGTTFYTVRDATIQKLGDE